MALQKHVINGVEIYDFQESWNYHEVDYCDDHATHQEAWQQHLEDWAGDECIAVSEILEIETRHQGHFEDYRIVKQLLIDEEGDLLAVIRGALAFADDQIGVGDDREEALTAAQRNGHAGLLGRFAYC